MASALESLPAELLAHIVDRMKPWLSGNKHRTYLLPLSLTSKTMHDATTAALYSNFFSGRTCENVRHFLRSICSNAELPKLVRVLRLEAHHEKPVAPTPSEFALFSAALIRGMEAGPLRDRTLSALRAGCHIAEMLVIVCMTTQVTRLYATVAESEFAFRGPGNGWERREFHTKCTDCPLFQESLALIALRYASYSRLENLTLDGGFPSTLGGYRDQRAGLFEALGVHSLRSLTCSGINIPSYAPQLPATARASKIRSLTLRRCPLTTLVFNKVLNTCEALEILEYSEPEGANAEIFDVNACHTSLYKHRGSLKKLHLGSSSNEGGIFRDHPALGSLLDFTRLEDLSVDELVLTGGTSWKDVNLAGILPVSITKLNIQCHGELDGDIGDILVAFNGWVPTKLITMEVAFEIVEQRNSSHLQSWWVGADVEEVLMTRLGPRSNYEGLLFVINGSPEYGNYSIEFICMGAEVCREFAAFGLQILDKGFAFFVEAAHEDKEVTLWKDGPVRRARDMLFDMARYDFE